MSALLAPGASTEASDVALRAIQFKSVTAHNRLRDAIPRLGGAGDTTAFRKSLGALSRSCRDLAVEFRAALDAHPARSNPTAQKIVRDFQALLRESERLMAAAREREAASLPRDAAAGTPSPSSAAWGASQDAAAAHSQAEARAREEAAQAAAARKQELAATEAALQFNTAVIEEREVAVAQISSQIGEVHEIFQDLAVLVSDQGTTLDDIESHIASAAHQTADARVQLVGAERTQRRARNTWCFLLLLAGGVLTVLMLVLLA